MESSEIVFTEDQQRGYDAIMSGRNVCVLGIAGAGKSFLITQVIETMKASNKSVCVTAPTGIAAVNVGGSTVHRLLKVSPSTKLGPKALDISSQAIETLEVCDVVIVDEISMCRADLFDYLYLAMRQANRHRQKHIQLICVGDFYQLPPVVTRDDQALMAEFYGNPNLEGYAFQSKFWNACNFLYVNLSIPVRQTDINFVNALNQCRNGMFQGINWIYDHSSKTRSGNPVILCSTNKQVDRENETKLQQIPEQSYIYRMVGNDIDKYKNEVPAPKDLIIKKGARVMTLVNDSDGKYQNGSLGTVTGLYKDHVEVKLDSDETVIIGRHSFEIFKPMKKDGKLVIEKIAALNQIPIKLAYALTMHKSQGQTLDSVYIYPNAWAPGQLYTAITRARNVTDITFDSKPSPSSLITSDRVIQFFNNM